MIEHPSAIFGKKETGLEIAGRRAKGRCTSAHLGAYDYTASLGIGLRTAFASRRLSICRQMMLAHAPVGIRLSDSVTTQMPIAVHKGPHSPMRKKPI